MPIGTTELSAPPATMTSASPRAIMRAASPMAWAPVAQAVTTEWFGPFRPWRIEIWPEARLIRAEGMKKGLTRRTPCSFSTMAVSAMGPRPPMPEPTMTPVASLSSSVSGFQFASARASSAAAMAYRMKSSTRLRSLADIT
ncbi:hypothetical protein D3C72_1018340 [compost metagenome]